MQIKKKYTEKLNDLEIRRKNLKEETLRIGNRRKRCFYKVKETAINVQSIEFQLHRPRQRTLSSKFACNRRIKAKANLNEIKVEANGRK